MQGVGDADVRFAAGVPNVGPFGDPLLLTDLAVAAEDSGWDAFFIWDHLLYRDQRWPAPGPGPYPRSSRSTVSTSPSPA